jgi:hypothetical protein
MMNYTFKEEPISYDGIDATKFSLIDSNGNAVSYNTFLDQLETGTALCELLTTTIANKQLQLNRDFSGKGIPGFYWECVPVSNATQAKPFEFVLIPCVFQQPFNSKCFDDKRRKTDGAPISFKNLGKDADLIIPTIPTNQHNTSATAFQHFRQIGSFMLKEDKQRSTALWKQVARTFKDQLNNINPNHSIWMSTDGRSEAWLHFRLDTKPKYTKYVEFRNPSAANSPATNKITANPSINKDELLKKIKAMHDYGQLLKEQGASKGQVAVTLAQNLNSMTREFFALQPEKRDEAAFKRKFLILLHSQNQEMSAYRMSWGTIVANIAIALTGIGLLSIVAKLIDSKVTKGRALFFFQKSKTTSEEKIADIDHTVRTMNVLANNFKNR